MCVFFEVYAREVETKKLLDEQKKKISRENKSPERRKNSGDLWSTERIDYYGKTK